MLKEKGMKGKIRAEIDMKKIDEQLEKYLDRAWMMKTNEEQSKNIMVATNDKWELAPRKLTIMDRIAQGTFGSVHKGVYDGKEVAVKVFDLEDESKRSMLWKIFTQEVSLWKKLDHPNIAQLIGAKRDMLEVNIQSKSGQIHYPRNACCIVVEYLRGGTLKSYLIKNRTKKLSLNIVIQLALDIAMGLSYLHSKNIVHRDVKTDNILLLDKTRRAKIIDFGVSRLEALHMTGQTGTLGYMAPEVLCGSPYDHKCDIYSFGICLWEIYCCAMPYPDLDSFQKSSTAIYKTRRPEIPESCPSSLANVMKQCWDADPKKRPEMEEVILMLEAIDTSRSGRGCFCLFRQQGH